VRTLGHVPKIWKTGHFMALLQVKDEGVFMPDNRQISLTKEKGCSVVIKYTHAEWKEVIAGKKQLPYCPDLIEINRHEVTIYPSNKGYCIGMG